MARRRNLQDRKRVVQRMSRTKIPIALAWLQYPHISGLVTVHTDIVGQLGLEMGRIYDEALPGFTACLTAHRLYMRCAGTVASLAADGDFRKWLALVAP